MPVTNKFQTCLWFDNQGEEAAKYYMSIFKNSRIVRTTRYSDVGFDEHHRPAGMVMTVDFELDGSRFMALNGGPEFKFNEAVSIMVNCETQEEIDYYWEKLGAGGDPKAQQCGWLKDKFGLSWQIVPNDIDRLYEDENSPGAKRAMAAMMQMKKIDKAALERAYAGK